MADFGRISGIASGFDTESIIRDMLKVRRLPVDKLMQKRQVLEWQRVDYRDINKSLLSFRNNFSFNMRLQSTFLAKSAISTDTNVLTASANTNTQNATYHVQVSELAKTAYNNSSEGISADPANKIQLGAPLWTQMDKFGAWQTTEVTGENIAVTSENSGTAFYLDNKFLQNVSSVSVDGNQYEVYYTRADFDESAETNKVLVDTKTGKLTFAEKISEGAQIAADYTHYENTFTVTTYDQEGKENSWEFTIDFDKDNLYSVLAAINSEKSLGLTAYYDESSDKVSIATAQTGKNNPNGPQIDIGTTGFLAETLKINVANEAGGTDARLTVNGLEITRHSNDFTLNNVNFSVKDIGASTISVKNDTDGVVETITNYINEYNKILLQINGKLNEEVFRDYPPLTDEQREQLSEKQAEHWEEKSRSGLLRNDLMLGNIVYELRASITGRVTGLDKYSSLAAIGITTGDYREQGQLHINEDKLRAAVEDDPDAVMKLFTAEGSGNSAGIGRRVDESLKAAQDKLTKKAGNPDSLLYDESATSLSIRDIDKQITRLEERIATVEERYWRQFTAMEQALSKMYAQGDWLQAQLMSMMGG